MKRLLVISGVLFLAISCAKTFAPRISDTGVHRKPMSRDDCLTCHLQGDKETPRAPKRMLKIDRENCKKCHW